MRRDFDRRVDGARVETPGQVDLDAVRSQGYAFQVELTYRALQCGFRVREIPIVFTDRVEGQSKMDKRIVREAIWMVWWLRIKSIGGRL